tara:strand:- start:2122 stop:2283 length:162 start_codon:yes stop_codon:yes gene_type:complete
MNKEELRLTMIIDTFRDKLIELDEQEFINWVEVVQFPIEEVILGLIKEKKCTK